MVCPLSTKKALASTVSSPPVTSARVTTRMFAPMPFQSSNFGASGFMRGDGREQALGHELEQVLEAQVGAQDLG